MKVLGMISGIGSMLIGAKQQGWDIVGNIEWRPYYHTGTFEYNFPGSFMVKKVEDLSYEQSERCKDLDLIIGHTECGNYSNLRTKKQAMIHNMADIPDFINAVKKFSPKMFAMDNLPKSLISADWQWYHEQLPEYDILFEWVSNYNYGNIQKHRRRLFVIGAKKELGFHFIPNEKPNHATIQDIIGDLPIDYDIPEINHVHAKIGDKILGWNTYNFGLTKDDPILTLERFQQAIRSYPSNSLLPYINRKGETKLRPGYFKVALDRHSPVLTGGGSALDNHYRDDTLQPLTQRERARIQGAPDSFLFMPVEITDYKEYSNIYKQIGKFMSVQFCTYLTQYIMDFLSGPVYSEDYSCKRLAKPDPFVDKNRMEYCVNVGYEHHDKVCQHCWLKNKCPKKVPTLFSILK